MNLYIDMFKFPFSTGSAGEPFFAADSPALPVLRIRYGPMASKMLSCRNESAESGFHTFPPCAQEMRKIPRYA